MSETTGHASDEAITEQGVGSTQVEDAVVAEDQGSTVTDDLSVAGGEQATSEDALEQVEDDDAAEDDEDEDEDENPLEAEAEVAADYLEELLDIADLDGDIDTFIEGDRAHVSIVSESKVLVGQDGAVLDALQELTRLAVMTETGNRSRLMLDVAGYRETRRKELLQVASDAVEEVRTSGERVALQAMNPFERKIVHDAVASAGLVSESEGEEPRRHVVVLPAS
jgi:spoIIIJ-associated protein